jgi:hypothetical protein
MQMQFAVSELIIKTNLVDDSTADSWKKPLIKLIIPLPPVLLANEDDTLPRNGIHRIEAFYQ